MSEDILKKRKEALFEKFGKRNIIIYSILAVIVWFGYYIRTRNLWLLTDVTSGKWIAADLDAQVFMRYAKYLVEHGRLFDIDPMRYYPLGFNMRAEVPLLPYFIAYLYKFLHFFNPAMTVEKTDVLYPAIAFAIALVFFFLAIKRLFDYRVAIVSTAFATVIPPFLHRTMAGYSDKEALAIVFIFMTFYFFVRSWQEENLKVGILFAVLAAMSTALTSMTWGGVAFIYMTVGIFGVFGIVLDRFSKKDFYVYSVWMIVLIFLLQFSRGGGGGLMVIARSFMTSPTTALIVVTFFMGVIKFFVLDKDILKLKTKIGQKAPLGFATMMVSIVLIFILVTILIDPLFIVNNVRHVVEELLNPLPNRWVRTVAENHEPYIMDWISQMGFRYIMLAIAGSALLVYESVRRLKKIYSLPLVGGYLLFLLLFIFSRYSASSKYFNGVTTEARFAFIGSLACMIVGVIIFYLYIFYKDEEGFKELVHIKKEYILVIVLFVITAMSARRAIRLVFIFAPITTIFFGYLVVKAFDYAKGLLKKDWYKIIAYILIGIITVSMFSGFAKTTLAQAKYTGSIYNQQWQRGGQWIRENTPKDAVFAHWWDYGYMVQTGGERATITDGGNAMGYFNYLMGRHVLTGQSDEEPLPFLKSHNATHLLIVSEEIGKYPAFSSIGSDVNYDRYSWINTFVLDTKNTQELRDKVVYLYRGGTPTDEDLVYQDKLYPKQAAGIGGFFVSLKQDGNKTSFEQPSAVMIYNGQQIQIPLNCLFINGQEIIFGSEGLDGCLMIIPKIEGDKMMPIGAALYLSPKVRKSRIAQLYLFGKQNEYFKLAYTDQAQMPIAYYNGRFIGPMKIWEISYPQNIEVPPEFYGTTFPDIRVTKI